MAVPSGPPPTEVHRLTRDIRVGVYSISAVLFLPWGVLLGLRLFDPSMRNTSLTGILCLLAAWAAGTAIALVRARIARLEILPDGFRYVSLFRDSRFRYEDIAGFRTEVGRYGGRSAEALGILYDAAGRRRLRISAYLERPKSLRDWMHAHFRDLDAMDAAEEKQSLTDFSAASPGRLSLLRTAANGLNIAGFLLALVMIFRLWIGGVGSTGGVIALLLLALPPIVLWLRARFGRLVSFEQTIRRSRIPRMDSAFFGPLIASVLVAFLVPPMRYGEALLLALAAGLFLFFLTRRLDPRLFESRFLGAVLLAFCLGYGYGLICFVNAAFDRGTVDRQTVVVRSRSAGRRGDRTVVVTPLSSPDERHSVTVSRSLFESLSPESSAVLLVKPGALGIPWISGITPEP